MTGNGGLALRRNLLLAAAAILLTQQVFAATWLKSLATAQKKAKEQNALIFVDLFADWCGWCHKMEQEVFPSEVFQKATENKVLLRLNTEDSGEGTKIAQQFSISTLPTFLLLTPEGTIAGMLHGYLPANDFVRYLNDTENRYKEFEKRVAHESSFAKDYRKRLDLAKEFRSRYALADSEWRLKKLTTEQGVPADVRDQAYYELAFTQVVGKRYDDGLKTIRKFAMVQSRGEPYEKSRLLAGDIYVQQGNYQSAVKEFRAFKANFPKSQFIQNVDVVLPQIEQRLARPQ
jgi:thioredoxin-related protein